MLLPIDLFRAVAEGVEISGIHSLPDGAQAITQMTISKCNVAGFTVPMHSLNHAHQPRKANVERTRQ